MTENKKVHRRRKGAGKRLSYPFYILIRELVRVFSPKFVITGAEQIPEGACIIVGNHAHMYGPIESVLYTPGAHVTWCIAEMMIRKEVAEYAYADFWSMKPKRVRWFYRILSHLIVPLAVCIFNNAPTIAVFRDNRVMRTFKETLDHLKAGERVVIFPEQLTPHNGILWEFREGFVDAARLYYKREKKPLLFVPMYVCPRLKKVCYGEPVTFDPEAPIEEERARICKVLSDRITELAVSLPEHVVVPYPNVPKKKYPRNVIQTYETTED